MRLQALYDGKKPFLLGLRGLYQSIETVKLLGVSPVGVVPPHRAVVVGRGPSSEENRPTREAVVWTVRYKVRVCPCLFSFGEDCQVPLGIEFGSVESRFFCRLWQDGAWGLVQILQPYTTKSLV